MNVKKLSIINKSRNGFYILSLSLLILVFTATTIQSLVHKHNCIYDQLWNENNNHQHSSKTQHSLLDEHVQQKILYTIHSKHDLPSKEPLTLNNTQPIRIFLFTDPLNPVNDPGYSCQSVDSIINNAGGLYKCKQEDILSETKRNYLINTILADVVNTFKGTLYVKPLTSKIVIKGDICQASTPPAGPIPYPSNFSNPGIEADLVLFVSARPVQSNNVLAFGFDCWMEDYKTKVGQLNFNPASISMDPTDYDFQLGVALHETSHVLGFTKDRFQKIPGLSKTLLKYSTVDGSPVNTVKIVSPKVVEWVRNHFGCNELDGAELEDQGGLGTYLSHWEKRIFNNEYMTGTASYHPVFSGLTLSLFEDLGFYAVNYTFAKTLIWGKGLGCGFVNNSCSKWNNEKLYCTEQSMDLHCTYDRIAKGGCTIQNEQRIPAEFDYLHDGRGGNILPDFCPWIEGNSYCIDSSNSDVSGFLGNGENYGSSSRCFESSLLKSSPMGTSHKGACYSTACLGNNRLKIKIEKNWYDCPYGSEISIEGFGGNIQCPDGNEVCFNAPIDNSWPVFTSIEPVSGGPGTIITIIGENFRINSTIVTIQYEDCIDIVVFNSTTIIATISNEYFNPKSLVSSWVNIFITDTETGKNAVGVKVFDFKVPFGSVYLGSVGRWLTDHWYVIVIAGLTLVLILVLIIRCCLASQKKKELKKNSRIHSNNNSGSNNIKPC
eukprot:gene1922-2357_t